MEEQKESEVKKRRGRPSAPLAEGPTTVYEAEQFSQFFINMAERHPEDSIEVMIRKIIQPKGTPNVKYMEKMRDLADM